MTLGIGIRRHLECHLQRSGAVWTVVQLSGAIWNRLELLEPLGFIWGYLVHEASHNVLRQVVSGPPIAPSGMGERVAIVASSHASGPLIGL